MPDEQGLLKTFTISLKSAESAPDGATLIREVNSHRSQRLGT
jgi:hypothetical protein